MNQCISNQSIMLFKILIISLILTLSQAQVDNPCTVRHNGALGVCKVDTNCPKVQADAQRGIQPTLCGILDSVIYIVCCEDAKVSIIRPNEGDNTDSSEKNLSISEKKCLAYNKNTYEIMELIPLILDATTLNCKHNSIPLVVGGKPAEVAEFPFMALLGYGPESDISWQCGGTLISEDYVMTAAHCVKTRSGKPVVVRLGELDLSTENEMSPHKDFKISEITVHPNYTIFTKFNDIALIKLHQKVVFTNFIRPACLWNKNNNVGITSAIATGWGLTENAGRPSDILQKVSLSLVDKSICDRTFANMKRYAHGFPNTILCAGELEGGKDTCQGDSGGPLIITKEGNQCIYYAVGITSFGKKCALKNTPAVYTKVSEFVPWIEGIVWK